MRGAGLRREGSICLQSQAAEQEQSWRLAGAVDLVHRKLEVIVLTGVVSAAIFEQERSAQVDVVLL